MKKYGVIFVCVTMLGTGGAFAQSAGASGFSNDSMGPASRSNPAANNSVIGNPGLEGGPNAPETSDKSSRSKAAKHHRNKKSSQSPTINEPSGSALPADKSDDHSKDVSTPSKTTGANGAVDRDANGDAHSSAAPGRTGDAGNPQSGESTSQSRTSQSK